MLPQDGAKHSLDSRSGILFPRQDVCCRGKAGGRIAPSAFDYRATVSFSALPALNTGSRAAGISIGSPVEGLRPVRASRSLVSNVPKPTNCTRSPVAKAAVMVSRAAFSALSVSFLERPDSYAMAEINSVLFIVQCLFPG